MNYRLVFVAALVATFAALPFTAAHAYNPRDADARHCLNQPTNALVIKCSERYLSPQAKVAIAARSHQVAKVPKATTSG
jgi:hypothetical protein